MGSDATQVQVGWVSSTGTRGSIDILSSSIMTIALCTWSTICLDIPSHEASRSGLNIHTRKIMWTVLGILCPEYIMFMSLYQRTSAQRTVAQFHKLGHSCWTVKHAFFADMGGFQIQSKAGGAPTIINGVQLVSLVRDGYVECPKVAAQEIWDRSKANNPAKLWTSLHAVWFLLGLLSRKLSGLPLAPLEIFTGAIVFCSIGNFIFWFQKPTDVQTRVTLSIDIPMSQIISHDDNIINMSAPQASSSPSSRKSSHHNSSHPSLSLMNKVLYFVLGKGFAISHLLAWNCYFPTPLELTGWRIASLALFMASIVLWFIEIFIWGPDTDLMDDYLDPFAIGQRMPQAPILKQGGTAPKATFNRLGLSNRGFYIMKGLLRVTFVIFYLSARAFMTVEALISLRAQPDDVYRHFDVTDLLSLIPTTPK
ncbi:hypothetical protein F5Y16DRAFT_376857 [Xylariaceae sp. FL0255]|nr:hypothetical protein F5Y16DRAFT_376857 [Xylariaceae sp. FL0255]